MGNLRLFRDYFLLLFGSQLRHLVGCRNRHISGFYRLLHIGDSVVLDVIQFSDLRRRYIECVCNLIPYSALDRLSSSFKFLENPCQFLIFTHGICVRILALSCVQHYEVKFGFGIRLCALDETGDFAASPAPVCDKGLDSSKPSVSADKLILAVVFGNHQSRH